MQVRRIHWALRANFSGDLQTLSLEVFMLAADGYISHANPSTNLMELFYSHIHTIFLRYVYVVSIWPSCSTSIVKLGFVKSLQSKIEFTYCYWVFSLQCICAEDLLKGRMCVSAHNKIVVRDVYRLT